MFTRHSPQNSQTVIGVAGSRQARTGTMRRALRSLALLVAFHAMAIGAGTSAQARDTALDAYEAGTIVVKTAERKLYLVLGHGQVLAYPVAVGKSGKTWTGVKYIDGKYLKPAWSPPLEIKLDKPGIPDVIPAGAPENPMGAAAMTLNDSEYAIHGTNNPDSIGRFASYGCIRMHNRDIIDLFSRVDVGTRVVVLR
jgi:lipoprotein-anchoring transpeptidase ErfK/SrfK